MCFMMQFILRKTANQSAEHCCGGSARASDFVPSTGLSSAQSSSLSLSLGEDGYRACSQPSWRSEKHGFLACNAVGSLVAQGI